MPKSLEELFTNQRLVKVGCDVESDQRQLAYYQGLRLNRTVDIQNLGISLGYQKVSLRYLAKELCDLEKMKLSKQTTHPKPITQRSWDSIPLNFLQYGAYDAVLTFAVYIQLINYDARVKISPIKPTLKDIFDFFQWLRTIMPVWGQISANQIVIRAHDGYPDLKERYSRSDEVRMISKILEQLAFLEQLTLKEGIVYLFNDSSDKGTKNYTKVIEQPGPSNNRNEELFFKREQRVEINDSVTPMGEEIYFSDDEAMVAFQRTRIQFPPGGIKIKSYINSLENSNWRYEAQEQRIRKAQAVVPILIRLGIFKQFEDRIFYQENADV